MKKKGIYILSILIILIAWQVIALSIGNPLLFPTVPVLFASLGKLLSSFDFYNSVAITIGRGVAGISISLIPASFFSILFARRPLLYELFRPLLSIMRSVPVISFILLALIFLNPEMIPLLIGFLTMFPILTENLTQGILNQNKELRQMGKLFKIEPYNYFTQIIYPLLKPFLYSGLATAAGFGWRAIIMGEVLSQCTSGIGSEMKKAQIFIAIPELLAWTAVAVLISFIADKGINRLSRWTPRLRFTQQSNGLPVTVPEQPICLNNITFGYKDKNIFNHFTLAIPQQQITGITAPSGKGKTTLLSLLNGLLLPGKGTIENRPDTISNVFQTPCLLNHLTVLENILLPLSGDMKREEATALAFSFLEKTELNGLENCLPQEISYGQQQRVAIARALAWPAPLLLMDEPFKGLDQELVLRILDIIKQHQRQTRQTIIFTSHQPTEIKELADYTAGIE